MKKFIGFLLIVSLISCSCLVIADDYSTMDIEELQKLKDQKISELTEINSEIGTRLKETALADTPTDSLGKIKDLFPDEELAMYVRDHTGKFSIEQPVTQEDLDKITEIGIFSSDRTIYDLTGIGYLRNLNRLGLYYNCFIGDKLPDEICSLTLLETLFISESKSLTSLPQDIGNLHSLKTIILWETGIESLPDSICDLQLLQELDLSRTPLKTLPENIGNLLSLEKLYINETPISSLPESIGNLQKLKILYIGDTLITELPNSIWNLNLDTLDMTNLPIK